MGHFEVVELFLVVFRKQIAIIITNLAVATHAPDPLTSVEAARNHASVAVADETSAPESRKPIWRPNEVFGRALANFLNCGMI